MHLVSLDSETDFDGWRRAARALVLNGIMPLEVRWSVKGNARDPPQPRTASSFSDTGKESFNVPAKFVELARTVILHRDPLRFRLLHRLLWRARQHHDLLDHAGDPEVRQARAMANAVRRDKQRMQASLRFQEIGRERTSRYVAWFAPEHHVVPAAASFFARRYADLPWSILTPDLCAHFDGSMVSFTPGLGPAEPPAEDRLEETWRSYSARVFKPLGGK